MTAPLPDAVGVVERFKSRAAVMDAAGERAASIWMSEAAALIQSQAARIAELEADKRAMQVRLDRWEPKPSVHIGSFLTGGPPTLSQREAAIRNAKQPPCTNCGKPGSHFVPPSLGQEGFYSCQARSLLSEGEGTDA